MEERGKGQQTEEEEKCKEEGKTGKERENIWKRGREREKGGGRMVETGENECSIQE